MILLFALLSMGCGRRFEDPACVVVPCLPSRPDAAGAEIDVLGVVLALQPRDRQRYDVHDRRAAILEQLAHVLVLTIHRFALADAHDLPCGACHAADTYAGLDPACASCHEPDRPAGHFVGTDCGTCHVATRWEDAVLDHDPFFPTPHHGVSACADCHIGGDTSTFSCIDCHEHSRAETDGHHREVGNYRYESQACLDCHRNGEGDD